MSDIDFVDFRARLTTGFKTLRSRGYFARQNWQCCQSCGCAALPSGTENYVFYHAQDRDRMKEAQKRYYSEVGDPNFGVYLAWGGDGEEIRKAFLEAGLAVKWHGNETERIFVGPVIEPVVIDPSQAYREQLEHLIGEPIH